MTDAKLPGLEERFAEVKGVRMRYFLGGRGRRSSSSTASAAAAANWTELAPLPARAAPAARAGPARARRLDCPAGCLRPRAVRRPGRARGRARGHAPRSRSSDTRSAESIVLRMALRRPADVPAIVLAGSAGLSIGNVWGRNLLSVFSAIRPGRLAARYRGRVVAFAASAPVRLRRSCRSRIPSA